MIFRTRSIAWAIVLSSASVLVGLAADFAPARRVGGSLPQVDVRAVGWTDVRLGVEVDANGAASRVTALRATPGALASIASVVENWRFLPADYLKRPAASEVLVVAMFRPPQLFDNPSPGSPAVDLAAPTEGVPFPVSEVRPRYPTNVITDAVVLVEVLVGTDGRVGEATLIGSAPGFESAALGAAHDWLFRPARYRGETVPAYVYLIFGFRAPVTVIPPAPGLE